MADKEAQGSPLTLFTIQVGKWRVAHAHRIPMIDTTVRSGLKIFAPTWDIVLGHKNGTVSDEEYIAEYRRLMIASMIADREKWEEFINDPEPRALACYCRAKKPDGSRNFCHRYLLIGMFEEICKKRGKEFHYIGELE